MRTVLRRLHECQTSLKARAVVMTNVQAPSQEGMADASQHESSVNVSECSNWNESLRSAKIMIVDDEPINVTIARKYLNLAGYQNFVTTTDARQALQLLEAEHP